MRRFPSVIGCIDGTHIRIQAPAQEEHEFINRKNFHSINVQVICDADMCFINGIAKWPGSVHDARSFRQSPLFADFEGNKPPLDGIILGDSGYMLRTWLMTPIMNPTTRKQTNFNFAHSSTRTTVERSIGVAKQRFHCLRCGLRLQPPKACKVSIVCFMLHNHARRQKLPPPDDATNPSSISEDGDDGDDCTTQQTISERTRTAAGKTVRDRIINECF
ncbi:putative nuclease HARBI1 [Gigantopelta aegis]|uniref:putative nuclease HARBI1 n=1 Tax=Gigantopelta aegis TaxID=1735272 RepID=UPI001B887446|nr:putative nuclease HARBI1 [Gigantopelta aegis]